MLRDVGRYGYAWSFGSDASAEDQFRSDLLTLIDLLRGLGARGLAADILTDALGDLDRMYGHRAADGGALTDALRRAAEALLRQFPDSLGPEATSDSARRAFERDHRLLRDAAFSNALGRDWKLWQNLRNLRLSKRGAPTPDGYDALAEGVMQAAEGLLRHPGPLDDARTLVTALVTGAQQILSAYDAAKRTGGLIDYADMIVETETLLRKHPQVLAAVLAEIDCVVIDEFQDTNPVQFALLWRLARGAARALIVGDAKQSIMGFQGADARLSAALQHAHPDATDPLDRNWRSDPRIMGFVNTIGPALFPEGYDALAPTRAATGTTAMEAIVLAGPRTTPEATSIADRIETLLATGEQVWDKATGTLRPARHEDIAVLCYRHADARKTAEALSARGLPVRVQSDGWRTGPAVRAARAALHYAADPDDTHAALSFLTLGPPAVPLEDAMRMAVDGVLSTHAALEPLCGVNDGIDRHPVATSLARVLEAGCLRDWAAGLADPGEALADLARLEGEAQAFDRMDLDLRAAAGFHGAGPQVFLGWIVAQTERDWDTHPDPDGWSGTGIELCTWHAAKGREWPVTVVAGLTQKVAERPGTFRAEFDRFDDLDNVLDHAGLRWLPDFAAPEKQRVFADALIAKDEADAARALYVALTRARDRLILTLPPRPGTEKERPDTMVALLRDRTGLVADAGTLTVCGQSFPARITEAVPPEELAPHAAARRPAMHFGDRRPLPGIPAAPWRRQPSSAVGDGTEAALALEHIPLSRGIAVGDPREDAATRGTAWHLAFRTLSERPDLAATLPAATGLEPDVLAGIAAQADGLKTWLAAEGFPTLHHELPLQLTHPDGSQTNAIVDCLAEGPDGVLIVDHKSGACPDPDARFPGYLPQLLAYAELVPATMGKPVRGIAIHWMRTGVISRAALTVPVTT